MDGIKKLLVINPCRQGTAGCVCDSVIGCQSDRFIDMLNKSQSSEYEWIHDFPPGSFLKGAEDAAGGCDNVIFLWPSVKYKNDYEKNAANSDEKDTRPPICKRINLLYSEFYYDSLQRNKQGNFVIHVTFKTREALPKDIAYWESPVLLQEQNEHGFKLNDLLDKINEPPLHMVDLSPCGHIAYGLAWTYYAAYLRTTQAQNEDAWNALRNSFEAKNFPPSHRLFEKRIIILPASGLTEGKLECGSEYTTDMKWEVTKDVAGVVGRTYTSTVYKVKDNDGNVFYAPIEYCTPIRAMEEMEKNAIGGMSRKALEYQIDLFRRGLDDICDKHGGFELILFLWFQDRNTDPNYDRCAELRNKILNLIKNNR